MTHRKTKSVRVDRKGRLTIPKEIRDELDIKPGDTFFVEQDGEVLHYARPENPFDTLALHAEKEYQAGRMKSLREFARDNDIPLDDE